MSCAHSVGSQASVCHTKPFVEGTDWRELTVGMREVRERWGNNLSLSMCMSSTEITGNPCLNKRFF